MKPAPFAYARPTSVEDAVAALAGAGGTGKVLAGGQSLVPLLSMRLASPDLLVDLAAVPGLDRIEVDEDGVRVGALVRHAALLRHPEAGRVQPLLPLALGHVAHATIRNRGTTVGSLAHADPAAEMPAVLALLQGSVDAVSPGGRRTVPADELFVGPLESSLGTDEIAVEAHFPALAAGSGVGFTEISRRHGDYALCGVAALVALEGDRVTSARAAYVSVGDVPTVVDVTAPLADGVSEEALAAAGEAAREQLDPQGDIHATADYRGHLAQVLTGRALAEAVEHARQRAGSDPAHERSHR